MLLFPRSTTMKCMREKVTPSEYEAQAQLLLSETLAELFEYSEERIIDPSVALTIYSH
ncbi:hypothetical protein CFELI_10450 [Corynebacterium felinum]|nr:hypothetical protein CFELI_10450 [Corynebacterium felinum]